MKGRENLHPHAWVEAYVRLMGNVLTKKGRDWVGPCPVCIGEDRFSIAPRGTGTKIHCRGCAQDKPKGELFGDIADTLFGTESSSDDDKPVPYNPEPRKEKPKPKASDYGCTVQQFLERIAVPILPEAYGITDDKSRICIAEGEWIEVPSVRMPSSDIHGEIEIGALYRVQVSGKDKYRYERDTGPTTYGLPWLLQGQNIGRLVICEGHSDAITLHHHAIPALGVPGVSNLKVLEASFFEGINQVFVVEEHDEAGEKFPRSVAARLIELGVKTVVLRLRLEAKDVNELYKENPNRFKSRFGRSVKEARGLRKSNVTIKFARDILARDYPPMRWAIPGLLPEGLVVLFASPKVGKSFNALQMAVAVANGENFSGKECWKAEKGEVIFIDLEQCEGTQMQGRFMHMGVDPKGFNMMVLDEFPRLDNGGMDELDILLEEHPACRLVIIDVWTNVKPTDRLQNENAYDSEYRWCKELRGLFLRRRSCCLVIHHDRKSDSDGGMMDKASGSKALLAAANSVLWLQRKIRETAGTMSITGRDGIQESVLAGQFFDRRWTFEPPKEDQKGGEWK